MIFFYLYTLFSLVSATIADTHRHWLHFCLSSHAKVGSSEILQPGHCPMMERCRHYSIKKRLVLLNKRGLATLANEFRSGLDAAPTRPTLQHFVVRKDKRQVLKDLNNVPKKTNGSKRNTGRQQHDNIVCDMPPAWGDIPEGTDARTFFSIT